MKQRITLYAEEGMILTDGEHFGTIIHLALGADAESYREITMADYERTIREREENQNT